MIHPQLVFQVNEHLGHARRPVSAIGHHRALDKRPAILFRRVQFLQVLQPDHQVQVPQVANHELFLPHLASLDVVLARRRHPAAWAFLQGPPPTVPLQHQQRFPSRLRSLVLQPLRLIGLALDLVAFRFALPAALCRLHDLFPVLRDPLVLAVRLALEELVRRRPVLPDHVRKIVDRRHLFARHDDVIRPLRDEVRPLVIHHVFGLVAVRRVQHLERVALPRRVGDRPAKQQLALHEDAERLDQLHGVEHAPGHVPPDLLVALIVAGAHWHGHDLRVVAEQRVHLLGPLSQDVPADVRHRHIARRLFAHRRRIHRAAPPPVVVAPPRHALVVVGQRRAVVHLHPVGQPRQFRLRPLQLEVLLRHRQSPHTPITRRPMSKPTNHQLT